MSIRQPKTLIVIPFGPGRDVDFLIDTVRSIHHYFKTGQTKIAIIDDSPHDLSRVLPSSERSSQVYQSQYNTTSRDEKTLKGAIWLNQISVIKREMSNEKYDVAIKMDDDALVCGDDPHLPALDFFKKKPGVGIIGAFTKRGDGSRKQEAMARKGNSVSRAINFQRLLNRIRVTKSPVVALEEFFLSMSLRYLDNLASNHLEYRRGNTCTGGCYFISSKLLNCLENVDLSICPLAYCDEPGEDTLMALLSYALGFSIGDFPSEGKTIAINWRGLPASPEALISRDITIVHPVKNDPNYSERHIRSKVAGALRE